MGDDAKYFKWRPIEEAPKDGTKFIGWWANTLYQDEDDVITTWYDDIEYRWETNFHSSSEYEYPTHWMPLPEPPKE